MTQRTAITEVMTSEPITVDRTQPISEAYAILRDAHFHHLVVVEGDEPVGVLATTDILRLVYDVDGSSDKALRTYIDHQFTIDDAMTIDLRTLPLSATVHDAADALSDGSFHSVVVLADNGTVAGIVTTTDLVRHLRDQG